MKKIFFVVVFLIITFFNQSINAQITGGTVTATFEIGRNSRGCGSFGICTRKPVKVQIQLTVANRNSIFDRTYLTEKEFIGVSRQFSTNLIIYFDQSNKEAIQKYMSSSKFLVEEDYLFRDERGPIQDFNIKTGSYDFEYDNNLDLYYIKF